MGIGGVPSNLFSLDTTNYYRTIMQQPKEYAVVGKVLKGSDITQIDSTDKDQKIVRFPNDLRIEYLKEKQDERYYAGFGKTRLPYQTTRIYFVDAEVRFITLSKQGTYYHPLAVYLDGYMGFEKMAEMLPIDFDVQ